MRKSLGDSRQDSQYIVTVPGVGYRFIAEVRKTEEEVLPQRRKEAKEEVAKEEVVSSPSFAPLRENFRRYAIVILVPLVAVGALAYELYTRERRPPVTSIMVCLWRTFRRIRNRNTSPTV